MTERNDEIAAFQILWPYSGWQAFELEGPQTEPGPRVDEQGKPIGED
jgi:hypothetical protein